MAPLPDNNTACYFVDYTVGSHGHTLLMRCDPEVADTDAVATLAALFAAASPQMYATVITAARFRQAGAVVSLPVVWGAATSYGSDDPGEYVTAYYGDWIARDTDGRRARATLFGWKLFTTGGNYRATPAESAVVQDVLDVLTSDAQMFWSIAGNVPVWYPYADTGINAYWRNKVR